jgi:hypothetical protein
VAAVPEIATTADTALFALTASATLVMVRPMMR